jgi:putative intracellular protease/amidase
LTEIAFLLYPDMTALDAVGPYEVLARLPGDPDPPFDSGSLDKAGDETRRRATEHMIPGNAPAEAAR